MQKTGVVFNLILKGFVFSLVLVWAYSGASLPGFFSLKIDSAHAVIAFTNLGASTNPDYNISTDKVQYSNTSWSPPTEGMILVFVYTAQNSALTDTISMVGNGLTWFEVASGSSASGNRTLTIFAADATGATTGSNSIDFIATQVGSAASFVQVTGVDLSGGVEAAFVQFQTNNGTAVKGAVTLNAAADSNNRPVSMFTQVTQESLSPRPNWTEIDEFTGAAPTRGINAQYRDDAFDTTASASWTTSGLWLGIASELKAESAAASTFTQSAFRFFENANSNQIGGPLANTNASASINTQSGEFRVRLALDVATANCSTSCQNLKLQAAPKITTCAAATYTDVTTTSSISYNNNATPADGDTMYSNGLDPQGTGTQIDQSYEETNNFTNAIQAINTGQHGLWDFSLKDLDADDNSSFCFRAVKSDDSVISYGIYPEIRTFDITEVARQIIKGGGGGGSDSGGSGGGTPVGGGSGGGSPPVDNGGSGGGAPQGGGGGGGGEGSPVLYGFWNFFLWKLF